MEYTKQPLDYPEQIQALRRRGLIIDDEEKALQELQIISYFRLACYMEVMEEKDGSRRFRPNSHFSKALSLYYFDKQLRSLLFTAIQSIEVALRAKIIHYVSLKYGAFWFAEPGCFSDYRQFEENLSHIRKELARSKEEFIREHYAKYSYPEFPPVWKTLEVVSFGTLSKLYGNLADKAVKKQIAHAFGLPQHLFLESWTRSLSVLRNAVAHHARLWNRRSPAIPQLPDRLPFAWISSRNFPPTKLYAQLCILLYLENRIHPDSGFLPALVRLLTAQPQVDVRAMGFPEGWREEELFREE